MSIVDVSDLSLRYMIYKGKGVYKMFLFMIITLMTQSQHVSFHEMNKKRSCGLI